MGGCTPRCHNSLEAGLLAILAKSIAKAITIVGGKSIAILIAILFPTQYCNTIAILSAILHLELMHTHNMAVSVNCIISQK